MGCESSEVFVTEWVLFLIIIVSDNTSLLSDNLWEVSRCEYAQSGNDRGRWVGHAVFVRLKRRPIHVCICSGGIARVDCKRRSVLVMPSCFFSLFALSACIVYMIPSQWKRGRTNFPIQNPWHWFKRVSCSLRRKSELWSLIPSAECGHEADKLRKGW